MLAAGLSFSVEAQEIIIDPLKQEYRLTPGELQKLDQQGNVLYRFSKPIFGKLSRVDLSDPFRILIYFSELNRIVFLNNKLSPIGEAVDLDKLDLLNPAGIANSKNGGVWILDNSSQSLVFLNKHLVTELKVPLRIFNDSQALGWFDMQEWKQNLFILLPGKTLYRFDLYGQEIQKIPVSAITLRSSSKGLRLRFPNHESLFIPGTSEIVPLKKKP